MQVKYPAKATKWQPQYIGFDTKQVQIDAETRIFSQPVIECPLSILSDQVEQVDLRNMTFLD